MFEVTTLHHFVYLLLCDFLSFSMEHLRQVFFSYISTVVHIEMMKSKY